MDYRVIDMEQDPRKEHFAYFSAMSNPYVGATQPVDITGFLQVCRAQACPFFLSFLYCVGRAANAVPQLRQRILDGKVIELARCDAGYTVMRDSGAYSYGRADCMRPFDQYLTREAPRLEQAKGRANLDDGPDGFSLIFVSCTPWFSFTSVQQPTPVPADSNPRIVWGKYTAQGERVTLPVSILANHALVDGIHIGAFFAALERELEEFARRERE